MSIKITDECINCGACEPECPNKAIYQGGEFWNISEGTSIKTKIFFNGKNYNPEKSEQPLKKDIYYIVPDKCTECVGFNETPQCASVCPVNCCILDNSHIESQESLMIKKKILHKENE